MLLASTVFQSYTQSMTMYQAPYSRAKKLRNFMRDGTLRHISVGDWLAIAWIQYSAVTSNPLTCHIRKKKTRDCVSRRLKLGCVHVHESASAPTPAMTESSSKESDKLRHNYKAISALLFPPKLPFLVKCQYVVEKDSASF